MRTSVPRWITLAAVVFALAGCGEEPMDEEEFLAHANTLCANAVPDDSEREVFAALRDVEPPGSLRDEYERALDKGSFAEAENDLRAMGLTFCAELG